MCDTGFADAKVAPTSLIGCPLARMRLRECVCASACACGCVCRCACAYVCLKLKLPGCLLHAHTYVEVCMRRRQKLCYSSVLLCKEPAGMRRPPKGIAGSVGEACQ